MRQLPHMNELQEKYGGKGLHIFTIYAQNHPVEHIRSLVKDKGIKYPLALSWQDEEQRWDMSSLPAVWIIGTDGKIAFTGKGSYEKVLEEQLAKVKYPGLGGVNVTPELESAAKAFAARDYAQALRLAEAAAEKSDASDATLAAAEAISERVADRLKALKNRAEVAEVENAWRLAEATWQVIERRFAKTDEAAEAAARLQKIKENKKAQLEMEAETAIHVLDRDLQFKEAAIEEWIDSYKKFAEKYKESVWAEKVKPAIERMEEDKKAADEEKKKAQK